MEPLDQCRRLRVGVGIEHLTRMRIATKKVFKPEYVAVVGSADNHWSAGPSLNEADPAQDQGAHDPLAEFRIRDQQSPQLVRWYDEDLYGFARIGV